MSRAFSFPRFTRQVQTETGVTNPSAGQDMNQLAAELEAFADRRHQDLARVAEEGAYEEGLLAGQEGAAPDGSKITLQGRAFNRGVIVSHQAALQTDIRDSVGQYHIDHPNDPDAFQQKVEGLSSGLLEEADPSMHAFIRDRLADYSGRAKLQIIERQQAELRAAATDDLQRGAEGFLEDGRTAAFEGDVGMIEARRQELTGLLTEGTLGGLVDEGTAAELLQTFEREITAQAELGNFSRHLQDNPDDDGAAAIRRWSASDPSGLGITVDDHEAVTRQMVTLRNRHRALLDDQAATNTALERAERKVRTSRVSDSIAVLRSGFAPDRQQAEQVAADIAWLQANGTPSDIVDADALAADFDVANAIQGEVHRFRRLPSAVRQAQLDDLEAALRTGGASDDQVALLESLQQTHLEVDRELETDPRGYVNREGLIADNALDFSGADALAASIGARAGASDTGQQLIGQPLPLLTAAEADQLAQVYQQSEVEERVGLLGILTAGAGEDAGATLEQLTDEGHRRMALLGGFVMENRGQLARDVMRGEALLTADPGMKPSRIDYQAMLTREWGAAMTDWPELKADHLDAAMAKYAELKARNGDLTDQWAPRQFEQALNAVMPTTSYNGRRVAIPADVPASSFDDWTDSWTAETFAEAAGAEPERYLEMARSHGRLLELGNGAYGIEIDSAADGRPKPVLKTDGTPLILEYPRRRGTIVRP